MVYQRPQIHFSMYKGGNLKEKILQSIIIKSINQSGHVAVKYHSTAETGSGVSDVIACIHGKFYAIEVKTNKGKLRKVQETFFKRVQESGGNIVVIHNLDEWESFYEQTIKTL